MRSFKNDGQHAVQIIPNVGVGETQNKIALMCEIKVAIPITDRIVAIIIHLNDQTDRRAEKVANIGFDHCLATEFETPKLRCPQRSPKPPFILRGFAAHVACILT